MTLQATSRRLVSVASGALASQVCFQIMNVVLPLHVSAVYGLDASHYARLVALRLLASGLGTVVLTPLSTRHGPLTATLAASLAAGVAIFLLGHPRITLAAFAVLLAVACAALAQVLVNLNSLTQMVDMSRLARANSIYRAVGEVAGIIVPVASTYFLPISAAYPGYGIAFIVGGFLLVVSSFLVSNYPLPSESKTAHRLNGSRKRRRSHHRDSRRSWLTEMRLYYTLIRGRPRLLRFICFGACVAALDACIDSFAALRLTRHLLVSDSSFGLAYSASAVTAIAVLSLLPLAIRRFSMRYTLAAILVSKALINALLCHVSAPNAALVLVSLHHTLSKTSGVPMNMWLGLAAQERVADSHRSRVASLGGPTYARSPSGLVLGPRSFRATGGTLTATYASYKAASTLLRASVNMALSLLVPLLGVPTLFALWSLFHIPLLFVCLRIHQPVSDVILARRLNVSDDRLNDSEDTIEEESEFDLVNDSEDDVQRKNK